ncbi:DUF5988 family protein [Streptomyces sp. NPDC018031]|uniref:DUF5988 family protein n=1 Tax=Streptomyces sp. NPDC018031 TaxID=3365033 RepID=UPI00379EF7B6
MATCQDDPGKARDSEVTAAPCEGNAVLRGSPLGAPADMDRIVTVQDIEQVLKLCKGSHYDHYLPTADWEVRSGRRLRVFRWSHRTRVAE